MTEYDVVTKLVGPIEPIGETNEDHRRLENLEKMTELIDNLIYDIRQVTTCKDRPEASMKAAGKFACDWCCAARKELRIVNR